MTCNHESSAKYGVVPNYNLFLLQVLATASDVSGENVSNMEKFAVESWRYPFISRTRSFIARRQQIIRSDYPQHIMPDSSFIPGGTDDKWDWKSTGTRPTTNNAFAFCLSFPWFFNHARRRWRRYQSCCCCPYKCHLLNAGAKCTETFPHHSLVVTNRVGLFANTISSA